MANKELINELKSQLENYAPLSYASDSGFISENVLDLVKKSKFPFFNIVPGDPRIEKVPEMSFEDAERRIMPISIQLGTSSMKLKVATMGSATKNGMLDFYEDIWDGIKSDRTVNGSVSGILPGATISIDLLTLEGERKGFIAAAEMEIEFFLDVFF